MRQQRKSSFKKWLRVPHFSLIIATTLSLSNIGELSCRWTPKSHLQGQKEKRKFDVACLAPSTKREIRQFYFEVVHWRQKKCTKNCNAADLLFGRSRCRRRNIERRFVSNENVYELVLGRLLNFSKIWYYISTYLGFCAKAGAFSRRCYERTRRVYWNCFNNRKLKLYSAVIRHLWSIYFGVH